MHVFNRTILTDSQCVLHWMRTNKPLPIFVQDEIQMEEDIVLGYIPSEQNAADFATRGLFDLIRFINLTSSSRLKPFFPARGQNQCRIVQYNRLTNKYSDNC